MSFQCHCLWERVALFVYPKGYAYESYYNDAGCGPC